MEFLKYDFTLFIKKTFKQLESSNNYYHNWHIDYIADHLEAVTQGHIKKLIINIPPRHMKSLITNVAWPSWLMGLEPSFKIISASYNLPLSLKHAIDSRKIMQEKWYQQIFPETILSNIQNRKEKFMTTKGGFRISSSINSSIIGEGADLLIVDDPHNPTLIHSKKHRHNVIKWFEQNFITRLNNKHKGAIILVMQRLHHDDLSGYLLNKNSGWHHLNLPVIVNGQYNNICNKKTYNFSQEILHPNLLDNKVINELKQDMGEEIFQAQYMQKPMQYDNGMLSRKFIITQGFDIQEIISNGEIYISYDTAFKSKDINDYSVGTIWCYYQNKHYLLEVWRKKLEYPELLQAIIKHIAKWHVKAILIEDKASGQILIQDLNKKFDINIIPIRPKYDKVTRFSQTLTMFEAEKIIIHKDNFWYDDYINELLAFPHTPHDDQVDSTSQYLNWMSKTLADLHRSRVLSINT